ncbi:hypothetical protein R4Z10_05830 [Niallia sp. XMNu-256]|uniref:hypothetical protein n=1 Tax=Niallia sp. XMNu-256 TaxID=3082444 RepID=UPI0030CF6ED1
MNQYLTIDREISLNSVNRLKRVLHKRRKYLKLKKKGNRYKINALDKQKLKRISTSISVKKNSDGKKQHEIDMRIPNTFEGFSEDHRSLQSIDHELTDIKKLLSFLVQQNEQSRLQQKNMKEQNEQLLNEINGIKQTLNEIKQEQDEKYEREYHSFTNVYKSLLYIEEKVVNISSKLEDKKLKGNWQKIFEK